MNRDRTWGALSRQKARQTYASATLCCFSHPIESTEKSAYAASSVRSPLSCCFAVSGAQRASSVSPRTLRMASRCPSASSPYAIDARLDTDKKTLDATETLTYRNLTGQPLTTFPFHLYLNAFRPESTFTVRDPRRRWRPWLS